MDSNCSIDYESYSEQNHLREGQLTSIFSRLDLYRCNHASLVAHVLSSNDATVNAVATDATTADCHSHNVESNSDCSRGGY